jgi:predicted AlkP superfamily pyrophosphatase or phosphodiesterase
MRRRCVTRKLNGWFLFLLLVAFSVGPGTILAPAAEEEARYALVISVDGLMPACYLRADALGLRIPNLRRLMARGGYARGVVGVLPTLTYPSHTTLITGVPPRVHGVTANTIFDPFETSGGAWFWYADMVRVPTLVSAARARWLVTASLFWPVTVGVGSDFNVPEFFRPGSTHEIDLKLLTSVSTPRLLEAVANSRGRALSWPLTDDDRADAAVYVLRNHHPHLTLLHLGEVDAAEHRYGPLSPEALAAVEKSDAAIGRVLEALEAAGLAGRTLVAVVSDHGFLGVSRSLRPNVLLRQAGLIQVDAAGKTTAWQAFFHANGGSAALRLDKSADPKTLDRVRALVEAKRAEPGSGIRRVLDRDEVARLGGSDETALGLDAEEGFAFADAVAGEWSSPAASKGYHGYAPDRPELWASLVVVAPGQTARGDLGVVPMTGIAPAIARWLGVSLSPLADPPLPLF